MDNTLKARAFALVVLVSCVALTGAALAAWDAKADGIFLSLVNSGLAWCL